VRLYLSGIRKLVRRPATWVTLGLVIGFLALIFVAVGASIQQVPEGEDREAAELLVTFPLAYTIVLSFILGLGGLLAVVFGAAIAGSEWQWGTLKSAVARGESRTVYTLATFLSIATLVVIGLLVAFALGIVFAAVGAALAGTSTDGINDAETLGQLPEQLARGGIAIVENAAIGFAVATILRSQLAGVGLGIGLYFAEQFAGIFVPEVVKFLPFTVASSVIATPAAVSGGFPTLDPTASLVAVVAWLVGALVVASLITERAEISG
jgi:hypothetical protein